MKDETECGTDGYISLGIFGNPFRAGNCEVHPEQHVPCVVCRQAQEQERMERIHDYRLQELHERKTEERKKLRDQFAMAALQGILANSHPEYGLASMDYAAKDAYKFADAMIKEREK